jgi:hypothetical protein
MSAMKFEGAPPNKAQIAAAVTRLAEAAKAGKALYEEQKKPGDPEWIDLGHAVRVSYVYEARRKR